MVVLNLMIGMITPPVGLCRFIVSAIGKAGDVLETDEVGELEVLMRAILQPRNLQRARWVADQLVSTSSTDGEGADDLAPFDPEGFVDALLG